MTTQATYKTTATGSIDYAHYNQRAREIRSQDTWNNIGAIRKALKVVVTLFRRDASIKIEPISKVAGREPMRTPRLRRARPVVSQAECNTAIR